MTTEEIELQRNRMRIYAMRLFGLSLSPVASQFGEIAQVLGHISRDQLGVALKLQETFRGNGRSVPRLGEILLEQGLLDRAQLTTVLDEQSRISDSTVDDSDETRFANLRRRADRLQREKVNK
tara:strand:- start:19225 stop:19593 length:369 start_codon:yes stop_codon:yes gene_type:complete